LWRGKRASKIREHSFEESLLSPISPVAPPPPSTPGFDAAAAVSSGPPPSAPSISNVPASFEEAAPDQGADELTEGASSTASGSTAGQSATATLFASSVPPAFTGLA